MNRTICIPLLLLTFLLPFHLSLSASTGLGLRTVVIDAGHGGKDPGAVSKDSGTYEKNIVLDIALKLSEYIRSEFPDVKVILTRKTDVFVTLDGRAEIANKSDADLFISIHVNSTRSTAPCGYSIHVLGQTNSKGTDLYELNMASVMRENSVIKLEDDYTASLEGFDPSDPESCIFMQLMQNAYLEQSLSFAQIVGRHLSGGPVQKDKGIWQNPFYVLWKTSMPAVLVELGYISNPADLAAIRRSSNRDALAKRLFEAFRGYKTAYDRSLGCGSSIPVETSSTTSGKPSVAVTDSSVRYGIQIFSGSAVIDEKSPQFLGYKPLVVRVGNLRKYIIAVSDNPSEPLSKLSSVRKKYPGAFVVSIDSNTVQPYRK